MKASLFKNCKTYVTDLSIEEIILQIKNGVEMDKTIALRQLLAEGKQEEYDEQKKSLLGFTPSGTFNRRRKLEFLNVYNGNIILDIDDLAPELLQEAEQQVRKCPYTHASFISPSAEGLKIIVRTNATIETHKATFIALAEYYEQLLNLFIDESGKDIPRLCFYSYDPQAYFNSDSEIFKQ